MDSEGLDPASSRQLDRAQRYAKMRMQGGGVGALTGALAGALIGSSVADSQGALVGGIGGAVAGAQLGYLAGAYYANLNAVAEDRRDDLNAQLAAARAAVQENQQAVADSRSIVKAETARIARLNQRRAAGEIQADDYHDELEGLNTRLTILDESLRTAENDRTLIEKTIESRGGGDAGGLAKQRNKLSAEIEQLRSLRGQLIDVALTVPQADREAADVELVS